MRLTVFSQQVLVEQVLQRVHAVAHRLHELLVELLRLPGVFETKRHVLVEFSGGREGMRTHVEFVNVRLCGFLHET